MFQVVQQSLNTPLYQRIYGCPTCIDQLKLCILVFWTIYLLVEIFLSTLLCSTFSAQHCLSQLGGHVIYAADSYYARAAVNGPSKLCLYLGTNASKRLESFFILAHEFVWFSAYIEGYFVVVNEISTNKVNHKAIST